MKIRKIKVSEIKASAYNPRKDLQPKDAEYQKLKKSIENFGYVDPIIWNSRTGNLIGGHQRLKILIEQGVDEVDTSVVDLPIEEEKMLNVALNKISGKWDENKLVDLLTELGNIPDFDSTSIGFDLPEISQLFDRCLEKKEDNFNFDAAVESIKTPVTKKDEIVELGLNRVLCGDSANPDDLDRLMNGEKADILDCDFPYNVSYMQKNNRPSVNTRPKKSRRWSCIYGDDMPQNDYELWMRKIMTNIKNYLKPGSAIYIWQGHRQIPPLYQILLDLGFHVSTIICWMKEMSVISYGDYSFRSEHALYGWLEGAPHYWAGKPGESNVWEVRRDPTQSYCHPTQKPVQLGQRALQNNSKINDIVLDTFLGSGSVLIAAESLGRRCYGLEIDPRYVDAIVRRYIAYKGIDNVSEELRKKYIVEVTNV